MSEADTRKVLSVSTANCRNLSDYLKLLSPEMRDQLYDYPFICLSAYRELNMLARNYVMRMLFTDTPIPKSQLAQWASPFCSDEQVGGLRLLKVLNIWGNVPGSNDALELNPTFKENFKASFNGDWSNKHYMVKKSANSNKVEAVDLCKYSHSRWFGILLYMIDPAQAKSELKGDCGSPHIIRTLLYANFIRSVGANGHVITRRGVQFLLKDSKFQTWPFLLAYMGSCEETELSLPDCLSVILQLSAAELGCAYRCRDMSPEMLAFLEDLRDFGFVYQVTPQDDHFYPTFLAKNIVSGFYSPEQNESVPSCRIIVETNFRFFLYTDSSLQISIVALFAEMKRRCPGVMVGVVTHESVSQALSLGIGVDQIVSYLEKHAHPCMGGKVPAAIKDRLKWWQTERINLKYTEGTLFHGFNTQFGFGAVRDYAKKIGALIWENKEIPAMLLDSDKSDEVKSYMYFFYESADEQIFVNKTDTQLQL